jgi:hypothetical protein
MEKLYKNDDYCLVDSYTKFDMEHDGWLLHKKKPKPDPKPDPKKDGKKNDKK